MKRATILSIIIILLATPHLNAQLADSADVYLITCDLGTESYSIYGHTALRVDIRGYNFDKVYNWGVFDFETPNFVLRFARGRLDYMLDVMDYNRFLEYYEYEERSVWSQKINMTTPEKEQLFELLNENIKPENIKYRYNFFFDNCATRVRDIIERSVSDSIVYPEKAKRKTFRQLVGPFQNAMPWLDFGADFLLGFQADTKASVRDELFLPVHLKENLSEAVITRPGNLQPVLEEQVVVREYDRQEQSKDFFGLPWIVIGLVLVFVILVTFVLGIPALCKITDIVVFSVFSVLSLLLIFSNFFSDHDALHFNLLIIAVSPLIPVLFGYFIAGKEAVKLSRLALTLAILWIPAALITGNGINPAILLLVLTLMVRLFRHCRFGKEF